MCLFLRDIPNKSKFRHPDGYRDLISIKCGHCSECRKEKELEYQHRAYSEYLNSLQHNGYTLFWTLTYDEEHVNRIGSMRVFSQDHIRIFNKRLNTKIIRYVDRQGNTPFIHKKSVDVYKTLLVSEYGGITHRPHYHMLIFVQDPTLYFADLVKIIRECWSFGRAVPGSGNIFSAFVNGQGALDYVSKYISKDDTFSEKIILRNALYHFLTDDNDKITPLVNNYESSFSFFEKYLDRYFPYVKLCSLDEFKLFTSYPDKYLISDEILKHCKPFHRQSQGFGLCLIDQIGRDKLFEDGVIRMPDNYLGVSEIPIPQYIQRHLFYNKLDVTNHPLYKNHDKHSGEDKKHYRYVLNEYGLEFKLKHIDKNIDRFEKTLYDRIQQKLDRVRSQGSPDDNQRYVLLYNLLQQDNKFVLRDFATYILVYRNNKFRDITGDLREDYKALLKSNCCSHLDDLQLTMEEFYGRESFITTYIRQPNKSKFDFAGHDLSWYYDDNFIYYDNPDFEEIYRLLTDDETKKADQTLNNYYRSIREEKARQKILKESHLLNTRFINHIKVS